MRSGLVALYSLLVIANLLFAWIGLLGLRPFRKRWQIVVWHLALAGQCVASAMFISAGYEHPLWRWLLRGAWLVALLVALIVIGQWMIVGIRSAYSSGRGRRCTD